VDSRLDEVNDFSIYQILPATLGLRGNSAFDRTEYRTQKNNISEEQSAAGA
jgi:hypothetical protein